MFYALQNRFSSNFCKIRRETAEPGFFLIKLQVSILQVYRKRLWYRYFLMKFERYLSNSFYRTNLGECLCSTEKYVISPLKKKKKKETAGKRNIETRKKKTETQLTSNLHILLIFRNFPISLFSDSHDTSKYAFLETTQPHWGLIYYRKLFLIFGNLTLVSFNIRIFVKIVKQENSKTWKSSLVNYGIHKIRLSRKHLEINN